MIPMNKMTKNIFLSSDRLPITLPGCFGNTEADTPGLDALAAVSCVFDRVYAEDADPRVTLRKMWDSLSVADFPQTRLLLTDDAELEPHAFFDDFLCVEDIPDQSAFAALLEMTDAVAAEIPDAMLWCHTREPEPEMLDAWVAGHVSQIAALTAVRGLAVRKITAPDATEQHIRRNMLHHQEIQLAWWVTLPGLACTRSKNLLAASDFGRLLRVEEPMSVAREAILITDAPRRAVVTDRWFLTADDRLDTEKEHPGELYLKPDDWWEQNDVADRCAEEMEALWNHSNSRNS